jgi:hypothetical protein
MKMRHLSASLLALCLSTAHAAHDVVIYGGTCAAVTAAVQV